ncbi:hypothetical protein OAN83_04075 [Alphaproteobacteria bacterium]|nr:hypothetical protein [Alphaproteobacteria bacterium]
MRLSSIGQSLAAGLLTLWPVMSDDIIWQQRMTVPIASADGFGR